MPNMYVSFTNGLPSVPAQVDVTLNIILFLVVVCGATTALKPQVQTELTTGKSRTAEYRPPIRRKLWEKLYGLSGPSSNSEHGGCIGYDSGGPDISTRRCCGPFRRQREAGV